MNPVANPFAVTTTLSVLLHSVVVAALLLVNESATTTGKAIDIYLVSSTTFSDPLEINRVTTKQVLIEKTNPVSQHEIKTAAVKTQKQLSVATAKSTIFVTETLDNKVEPISDVAALNVDKAVLNETKKHNVEPLSQSSSAMAQQESMLALLHATISEGKEYPYIARRQRREGVATVGFVLHPDGRIENAHLVLSSSTSTLDRAALAAVKRIEPFRPAQQYLEQSKAFEVDVIFNLL